MLLQASTYPDWAAVAGTYTYTLCSFRENTLKRPRLQGPTSANGPLMLLFASSMIQCRLRVAFRKPKPAQAQTLDRYALLVPGTRPDVVCLVREEGLEGSCHEAARLPGTWLQTMQTPIHIPIHALNAEFRHSLSHKAGKAPHNPHNGREAHSSNPDPATKTGDHLTPSTHTRGQAATVPKQIATLCHK